MRVVSFPKTDWHPQAKKDLWITEDVIESHKSVCATLSVKFEKGASCRFKQ